MKTITIRDLRQRWPEVEAVLQAEDEIIVTRDSKPVAKLVRVFQAEAKRPRWTPEEHRRWIKVWHPEKPIALRVSRFAGGRLPNSTAAAPEFRRHTLPLPGSIALACDGRIEGFTPDDSRRRTGQSCYRSGF